MRSILYASREDMVLGSVPVPTNGDAEKYLADAADEMDALLGARYKIPVIVDPTRVDQKAAGLVLKKINAWLASGRLVMAADSSGSDDQVQQYGLYLVSEATKTLEDIAEGRRLLQGVELVDDLVGRSTGPAIANAEPESLVESYSTVFGNPAQEVLDRPTRLPYSNWPYRNRVY